MSKIFVSHSAVNRAVIEDDMRAVADLAKMEAWFATDQIAPASHFPEELLRGLQDCEWFVVVISKESAVSHWVRREVVWALTHRKGRIIPVLLDQTLASAIHVDLREIHHVDLRDRHGLLRVLAVLQEANPRGKALVGNWRGKVDQNEFGPQRLLLQYPIEISLSIDGREISGWMQVRVPPGLALKDKELPLDFTVAGELVHSRFIQITYKNLKSEIIQFGSMVSELDDLGARLRGLFVGYGALSNRIISGRFELAKQVAGSLENHVGPPTESEAPSVVDL